MLKREIEYTFIDDEGKEVKEAELFYFHLSAPEINEWNAKYKEGLGETIQQMLKNKDNEGLLDFFKRLILDSYGVRANGGRSFVKSPELRNDFLHHAAYTALYMELATNEDSASTFFNGIFPKDVVNQDKPVVNVTSSVVATPKTP